MSENLRRLARVRVSNALLTECLLGNFERATTDAPPDMRVIGAGNSMPGVAGWVEFVVWSETFAPVEEGGAYPLITPMYHRIDP